MDSETAEVESVSTEEMTANILAKYCEWPKIEQLCATLNLRFPVRGLSSSMVAGFLVHCANADVEAVSGEAGLNAVNLVTDSQDWQRIPIVWLVLLLAMLMSFGLLLRLVLSCLSRMVWTSGGE